MKPFAEKFFKSRQWQKCRYNFLSSKNFVCERCENNAATLVHHKTHLSASNIHDTKITLGWNNLEALCVICHANEHGRKTEQRYMFDDEGNLLPP
jgi:5-methylcytosine-specific restriction endonuclease McrA